MFPILKNSYLQSNLKEINPRMINRCVEKARDFNGTDVYDMEPPFNRLVSSQPLIPVKNVDITRRPLAFGRAAMPKLKKELHHKDESVVIAALLSISDICHDPERAYEAVNTKVIDRMVDLLAHYNPIIRERTAYALQILARIATGRDAIVENNNLIENLQICVEDEVPEVRIHVAALIEMISRFWIAADVLVQAGFIQILLMNLVNDDTEIIKTHLETLKSLMYGSGKCIALDFGAFNTMMVLLEFDDPGVISRACECLTLLTTSRVGEKLAQEDNLLEALNRLLHDERPEVYTSAASTIMFCTVKTKSKIAAAKINDLMPRLIKIAGNKLNPSPQIFAIKALTNICEHPDIRKEVINKYYQDVMEIQIGDEPSLKRYKEILLSVIGWIPTCV